MNNTNDYPQDAPVLRKASRNRCLLAFSVTSLAAFLMIGLTWPLTMKGYRAEGMIEFENQQVAALLLNNELPTALKSVMTPAAIDSRLESIRLCSGCDSLQDAKKDDEIYNRISVGFRDGSPTQKPSLRVVLSGTGTENEARFIRSFGSDLATRLANAARVSTQADNPTAKSDHPIYQAQWLVDQIEEGLTTAKTQTAQLMAYSDTAHEGSAFRKASHVRTQPTTKLHGLHQTLKSVDVSSLRGLIEQLQTGGVEQTMGLVRFDADRVTNHPIGAVPNPASLMLAALLSVIIGGVVAWNIHPFAEQGFENVADVTKQLGVPVIGTLTVDQPTNDETKQPLLKLWANRTVRLSGSVLAAIAILGVGFWLTSAEVRESFSESWFHGFARIVWTLSGA